MTESGPAVPSPYPGPSGPYGAPGGTPPGAPGMPPSGPLSGAPGAPPAGPGTPPGVPEPPPGPGVVPPFAAPPTEGRSVRTWLGAGAGALALLLCCGGGGSALFGLFVTGTKAAAEQARVVTGDYYQALQDRRYDRAYQLLCDDVQQHESLTQFERRVGSEPAVTAYRVGEPQVSSTPVVVPVEVTRSGTGPETQRVELVPDSGGGGGLEVCGVS